MEIAPGNGSPEERRYALKRCGRTSWSKVFRFSQFILALPAAEFLAAGSFAQQVKAGEYTVKATYLYNFARFVEWPSAVAQQGPFAICVLGTDPFGETLDATLAGEAKGGKPVVARRVSSPRDSAHCRMLFISASESNRLKDILAAVDKSGVLTVSDMPEFTRRGGMIQFVMEGKRVRFEVNLSTARSA